MVHVELDSDYVEKQGKLLIDLIAFVSSGDLEKILNQGRNGVVCCDVTEDMALIMRLMAARSKLLAKIEGIPF